jgi:tRNA threonylcarbamoyladenosine biosynthesis protein TsaE
MRLGALLNTGDVICLVGDLGAGKTTFVQGIAAGWGSLDRVTSPTFVLVNVYRRPEGGRLYHLDAYRLDSPAEAEDLDLQPMLESGPLVVEWADRIKSVLPRYHLWVTMQLISIGQRDMVFTGHGNRYLPLMAAFRKQLYGGQ